MTPRLRKALRLATQMGSAVAVVGLFNALLMPRESDKHGRLFYVVLVPLLSFALFFILVFPLAYAFPPRTDRLTLRDEFPGARRVVWPIVILACAAVAWLVLSTAK
jgi:uncharacterized BrkB/YihY/UPF0761 family membrane protein